MLHMHHVVPRHMGGSNDPSNLIELTIKQHADAHRVLYEEHGKLEDYVAYKSLLKQMVNEERQEILSSIGGNNNRGKPKSESHKAKVSESIKEWHKHRDSARSEETIKKISASMMGNTSSKDHSSAEYKMKQSAAMKAAWARRKAKQAD